MSYEDQLSSLRIIEFPIIKDPRGNLTFVQHDDQIPFEIKRVFWTYDVPGGFNRGGHAYRSQDEIIVALSGAFDVVVNFGDRNEVFSLRRSYYGLYVPARTWRHMENFSTNSLALHLSSSEFDESDYVRHFEDYLGLIRQ